ncbi:MAG TPA: helix-turn-helix domain-containing protein [Thermoplasmatales archaeon]|nr:helix-turn-helix domain-containing protein [Thermoplasmatales archaeon]
MGRLKQKTVDRLLQLHRDGWIQQEIADELKIDPATVRKYVQDMQEGEEKVAGDDTDAQINIWP